MYKDLYSNIGVSKSVYDFVLQAKEEINNTLNGFDSLSAFNQSKVLKSFKNNRISAIHFNPTTGYGYSDIGREKLCSLFSDIFSTESSLISPHILSGTHAIFLGLSSLLKSGDVIFSAASKPYDTLATAIGLCEKYDNTLIERGIVYEDIDLDANGNIDFCALEKYLSSNNPKMVYIQRSRGYELRKAINIDTIKQIVQLTKKYSKDSIIVCDNCYGEFVEEFEPTDVGVDLIIGSLIKNPGAGIAPNGAYLCGNRDLIEKIEYNFTAPGIGHEVGSYNASYLPFFQGLFLAPKIVCESLKGATLTSYVMSKLGYDVLPKYSDYRTDITQSVVFNTKEELISFIQGIQIGSPVDSFAVPEPWDMPGYDSDVIMAAGTFIQGSSIELSADAPIKEPYIAYLQGGLTFEYHMLGLMHAISNMKIL